MHLSHKVVSNLVSSLAKDSLVSSAAREKVTGVHLPNKHLLSVYCVPSSVAKCRLRVETRHFFSTRGGEPWYIKDENRGVDQSHRMWPLYEEECLDLGEGAMCTGRRSHGCTCFGGWGWVTVLSIALL